VNWFQLIFFSIEMSWFYAVHSWFYNQLILMEFLSIFCNSFEILKIWIFHYSKMFTIYLIVPFQFPFKFPFQFSYHIANVWMTLITFFKIENIRINCVKKFLIQSKKNLEKVSIKNVNFYFNFWMNFLISWSL
jgi:hypothetical protein